MNAALVGIGVSLGVVVKYHVIDGGAEGMCEQGRQAAREDARSQEVLDAACEKSILNHPDQIDLTYILQNCARFGYKPRP